MNTNGESLSSLPSSAATPADDTLIIDNDMQEIVSGFVVETEELLEKLDQDLVALDQTPDNKDLVNEVFRSLHTMKGNSRALGFDAMNTAVHRTEDVIRKVREGEMRVTPSMMDTVLKAVDVVKALLQEIKDRKKSRKDLQPILDLLQKTLESGTVREEPLVIEPDMKEIVDGFIVESEELLAQLDQDLVRLEEKTDDTEIINAVFRGFHTLKGNSRALGFAKLEELDHKTEDVIRKVRDGKARICPEMMDVVLRAVDLIKTLLADIKRGVVSSLSSTDIMADLELVLQEKFDELTAKKAQSKPAQAPAAAPADQKKAVSSTVRVDIKKLDKLIDITGELVLNKNRLLNLSQQVEQGTVQGDIEELLNEINAQIGILVSDLQSGVMSTRMQPIGKVFSKYPRIVRDLARELGKEIELVITGQETELDSTIVDEIGDPLIHMIRNSCDHGIEMPEVRTANGKPAGGKIDLMAYHEGNFVIIEIRDNGKGMDPAVLSAKAIEKGIVTPEKVAAMSKGDILNLIFLPGFSTASVVTAVSGRGVGMDVVRTGIAKLNGIVELDSAPGSGTIVKIKLPLTLAVMIGLEVEIGDERYLVPQESIVEIVPLQPAEYAAALTKKEFLFRETYRNPLIDLKQALHTHNGGVDRGYIVVVGEAEKRTGIVVDNVLQQHEVVIKPLGRYINNFRRGHFRGATIMGDGSIELILDAKHIVEPGAAVDHAN
jgi:two-component system chemotaxis sensor kinase CheA